MITRIISALIGLIFFILIIFIGGLTLKISVILVALIAMMEMKKAFKSQYRLDDILSAIFLSLMFSLPLELAIVSLFIYIFISLVITAFFEKFSLQDNYSNTFAFLYTGMSFLLLYRLIAFSDIKNLYLLVFIISWGTDTFAYFVGMAIGTKKLIDISPNKTVEGAIGGLIGSVFLSIIVKLLFIPEVSLIAIILISIIASIIAQIGDIVASSIKRSCNVKDYGYILPGHGGILDRFDSVIFVTIFIYLVLPFL